MLFCNLSVCFPSSSMRPGTNNSNAASVTFFDKGYGLTQQSGCYGREMSPNAKVSASFCDVIWSPELT